MYSLNDILFLVQRNTGVSYGFIANPASNGILLRIGNKSKGETLLISYEMFDTLELTPLGQRVYVYLARHPNLSYQSIPSVVEYCTLPWWKRLFTKP